ncbi:MAG: tetraacyldisaccharide 4'-kinase [Mailhella sp.]|nr:tetraacyldisaccharide 4'-kinase [Mailhella sp.]
MAKRHPLQHLLAPLLLPLSWLYGAAGRWKRARSQVRWKPKSPCVAVGNISWGGTGKTPVTDWLLSWADRHDLRAAVLTRGYGARPSRLPLLVDAGTPASECGDEPLMLARRHPRASIVVDPERGRAGRMLEESRLPDIFFLDDGFQHVRAGRDLDLVLLDQDDVRLVPLPGRPPSNWNMIIPAGTWREPVEALNAAAAFLVKVEPEDWPSLIPALEQRLRQFPRPVFAFRMAPEGLRPEGSAPDVPALPASTIAGPYAFVSGIGDPAQAVRTVTDFMGRAPEKTLAFPDHHDIRQEKEKLEALGLPIICTEKDSVKLAPLNLALPCYALAVKADFFASLAVPSSPEAPDAPDFEQWWSQTFAALAAR